MDCGNGNIYYFLTPIMKWQVGGYVFTYKGLTFATVRGVGHMVPMDQGLTFAEAKLVYGNF